MPISVFRHSLAARALADCLFAVFIVCVCSTAAPAQQPDPKAPTQLRFTFEGAHWREVLGWLAREADLALQITDLPTGSLTYSDRRAFTPDEAIDRLNLFLIPRGFTLVRSGKLLSVISLDDERSLQQLDAMAQLVPAEELAKRGDFDVVKCLFQLGRTDPATVRGELRGLSLLREPVEFPNTGQLLVTGTAARLRTVQKIIESLEAPEAARGPVRQFPLKTVQADDVLTVVRPLVGLVGAELVAGDISLSSSEDGTQVFATGTKDKVDIVAMVVEMLDGAEGTEVRTVEPLTFKTHAVQSGNLAMVFGVLQTLLADEAKNGLRLAEEFEMNRVAAYATQDVHTQIDETIKELESETVEFEVIDLQTVDPEYAVVLLRQMFDVSTGLATDRNRLRIDADPLNQRLFVRGRKSQIAEIQQVIERLRLPGGGGVSSQGTLRMLPYQGERARAILDAARNFWPGDNEVIVVPSGDDAVNDRLERPVTPSSNRESSRDDSPLQSVSQTGFPDNPTRRKVALDTTSGIAMRPAAFVQTINDESDAPRSRRSPIQAQVTPQGILIQSDDVEALDRFEEHLQLIAGRPSGFTQHFRVFYLTNEKADVANRLLAELLGGTIRTGDNPGGSLISQFLTPAPSPDTNTRPGGNAPPPAPGLVETLSSVLTAGTATIVPETRLNRLFVQGTATDIAEIEAHLRIIDREKSLTEVKTYGQPRVVELQHVPADEMAAMLRDVYGSRVEKSSQQGQNSNQRPQGNQPQPQQNPQRGGQPQQRAQPQQRQQRSTPMMTIAVNRRSNSIIVTAPTQLADEVEALAEALDGRGIQGVRVLRLNNPRTVKDALREIFGDQIRSGGSSPRR